MCERKTGFLRKLHDDSAFSIPEELINSFDRDCDEAYSITQVEDRYLAIIHIKAKYRKYKT